MPLKNFDDVNHRFRSNSQPYRQRIDMDFRASGVPNRQNFPHMGATLPQQKRPVTSAQPSRVAQDIMRPRAAAVTASATDAAVAPAPIRQRLAVPKRTRKRRIITKWRVIFALLLMLVLTGAWLASKVLSNTLKVFNGNVFSVLTTTKLKGEDVGRVNFLVAGNSADDPGHGGADLTDSIMIISLDTAHNTAYLLSVPRDLWVDIPGYGHAKINEAYVDGEASHFSNPGYPNGGMGLLEEVIHNDFDMPIDYYGLINYNAFRDGVNAVGGVTVNIQSSDPRGLYDPNIAKADGGPLRLPNGLVHLDGQTALNLARARGDPCSCGHVEYGFPQSDFDRTEHQRMLLLALKSKVLSVGTLANPITLSNLFDTLGKNVKTDFTLSEARRAYDLGKNIDNSKIVSTSLNDASGKNLLTSYHSPNNESALIPAAGIDDYSQIQAFVRFLQTSDPVAREGANVVVLNGTDTVGLAAKVESSLSAKGINVAAIGDAKAKSDITTIIDTSLGKKPATLAKLKQIYGQQVTNTNPYDSIYSADFIIVLGADQVPKTPAQ